MIAYNLKYIIDKQKESYYYKNSLYSFLYFIVFNIQL